MPAGGQTVVEALGLDKLRLGALGMQAGTIAVSQVVPTNVYAITADYGQIAPHWRVVFGVSYWESRLGDEVVKQFVDSLRRSIVDSTGDASLAASRISLYDVTFSGALRYAPTGATLVRPFVDMGMAAHVMNAEGKLIKGTFVERALDQIAAGFFAGAGLQVHPLSRLAIEGLVRGDLLSGFRSAQLRAGATYELGPPRRTKQ